MHDRRPQFLAELTQMSADIDKLLPQFAQFAEHYKGLAMASHAPIPPALVLQLHLNCGPLKVPLVTDSQALAWCSQLHHGYRIGRSALS